MHVSGHACSEELRTLLSLVRPKALMPIHGEYRMLAAHAKLGRDAGIPADGDRDRGERLRRRADAARRRHRRPDRGRRHVRRRPRRRRRPGRRAARPAATLGGRRPDRRHDGRPRRDGGEIAPPELIARGFGENEELLEELREEADRIAEELAEDGITEIKLLQEHMHDAIAKLVYARTRRRPMILPVVIEV